jgi:catechol 2,3-dioxygenase-like lactoylglutathione lyase family enzyme
MAEVLAPVFRVEDAAASAEWYGRLGFHVAGIHRFGPGLPAYVFLRRGEVHLHLSEHTGDAPLRSLAYFYVDDVDDLAARLDVPVSIEAWGREIEQTDPDGNRVRIGTVTGPSGP